MAATQEFFTPEAVGQLTGAIAAVTAVSVTIRRLTNINSPLIPFVVSLILCYVAAGTSGTLNSLLWAAFPAKEFFQPFLNWLLPAFNACLLFTATIGATEVGNALGRPSKEQREDLLEAFAPMLVRSISKEDIIEISKKILLGELRSFDEFPDKIRDKIIEDDFSPYPDIHIAYAAAPPKRKTRFFTSWFDRS